MIALAALACALSAASVVLALALPRRPRLMATPRLSDLFARRRAATGARSVEVLRGTQAALRSGQPLIPALRAAVGVGTRDDPFVRIASALELNVDAAVVMRDGPRCSSDGTVSIALDGLSLAASEQLPSSRAAQLIGSVADRIAYEERLHGEVVARTAGARGQIVLLALLVPALTLYLLVTLPGLVDTYATPLCRFVLIPVAAFLEILGIVASRAIVRGVT